MARAKKEDKPFDVDDFKFNPKILKKGGGMFKAFLKDRYGKQYKASELKEIFDKFYGELDVENGESN